MSVRTCRPIICLAIGMIALLCLRPAQASGAGGPEASATDGPKEMGRSIEFGIGIMGSSGLDDAIRHRFPSSSYEISGSGTFFDAECGFGFARGGAVMVTPRLRFLGKSVTIEAYQGLPGSQYAVFIFLPGVSARYSLPNSKPPLYASADIAYVTAHGDDEILTIEGGGLSIGVSGGVSFKHEVDIELGYWSIPVHESAPLDDDVNFGGLGLVIRKRWFL